jgi:nucleoside-diphosphate-sugar epimerase
MKICITGHTEGLGLALVKKLDHIHEIIGLSRRNGYDIANLFPVLEAVQHSDIFINNAYYEYYQCNLLSDMFNLWKHDPNKTIITISSFVTCYPRIEKELDNEPWPYRDHKVALERLFRHLVNQDHQCKMLLVSPGAIDTNMVSHLNCKKMQPEAVADVIINALNFPLVKELTLYA